MQVVLARDITDYKQAQEALLNYGRFLSVRLSALEL